MMLIYVAILSLLPSATTALTPITDANFRTAVDLWFSNQQSCIETYGHISNWATGEVTSMERLFYWEAYEKSDFDEDLSNWDTSNVKTTK